MAWLEFILGFIAGSSAVVLVLVLFLFVAVAAATPSKKTIFGNQSGREGDIR